MRKLFLLMALFSMPLSASDGEKSLGKKDAPITLVEYGSLTCGACNYFHRAVLPSIKSDYIDAGKVRYVFRHFPTGHEALAGAVAAQCAGDNYYAMLNLLYLNIEQWHDQENPAPVFTGFAQTLGNDAVAYKQCLTDLAAQAQVVDQQREGAKKYGVIGTPTFVINGQVVKGKRNFAQMEALFRGIVQDSAESLE